MTDFHKLVRDNIPAILEQKGYQVKTHVAEDKEYWEKLKMKLLEEVEEFLNDQTVEKLADVMEVIEAICVFKKIEKEKLEANRQKKLLQKGGFEKRIILEEME